MENSKYWKDMFIDLSSKMEGERYDNRTIISDEVPIDFDKPNYENDLELEIHSPFTSETLLSCGDEIVAFMNKNNVMFNGITERISLELLESVVSMKSLVFILRYKKNNSIMGLMTSIPFHMNIPENTPYTLTTFLCVHSGLRNKGVSMMIIRKALLHAHSKGLLCSYYLLPKPFSNSAVKVKRWMRPIDVKKTISKGFEFDTGKKSSDRTNIKTKMKFAVSDLPRNVICKKVEATDKNFIHQTFEWIKKISQTNAKFNTFMWCPQNIEEWEKWCIAFPTFFVSCESSSTQLKSKKKTTETTKNEGGLISIQCKEIFIPESQSISNVAHIPFHMSEKLANSSELNNYMYRSALLYAKEMNQEVLFCMQTGDMTPSILERNNAVRTTGEMCIDFYNVVIDNLDIENVYVPLL